MIRQATAEDFYRVLPLARRFFDASHYSKLTQFDNESFKRTFEQLTSGVGVVLLAEIDSEVVGMTGGIAYPFYFNANHKTGQEMFWWVNPEARGSRVGAGLFRALEAWATAQGCQSFSMMCLESLRPDAVGAMYRRAGYAASEHSYIKELTWQAA